MNRALLLSSLCLAANIARTRRLCIACFVAFPALAGAQTSSQLVTGAPRAASQPAVLPARVVAIVMHGLYWTHPAVVETEIAYHPGDTIDAAAFALGVTRLWNTGIFARVDGRIETFPDGRVVATYTFEERFFLGPIFNFTFLSFNSYWFRAGLKDINTFGRFIEVEAAYERFSVSNGGYLALREPRLFRERIELSARFERLSRPRPEFTTLQTHGVITLGKLAYNDKLWFQGGFDVGYSDFLVPIAGPPHLPSSTWTAAFNGSVRGGRIDTIRLRQQGVSIELRPTLGLVFSQAQPFYAQGIAEMLAFFRAGTRFNFAFRINAGVSSQVPTQLRFYIGGIDQIRGFVDNYLRTDLYLVYNAEIRFIAFDGFANWLALVPVIFGDGVLARIEKRGVQGAASVGVGVRILVPKFPRTGLRVDLAQPLLQNQTPQLSLGAFQFF